jgi:hypothetical protein
MILTKPSEIFQQKIAEAYENYRRNPTSKFHANVLATALNDQCEWNFKYYDRAGDKQRLGGAKTLKQFRHSLFKDCPDLQLMWDLADVGKHRFLDRPSEPPRAVKSSTAAYVVEGNDLRVVGYDRLFSEAAACVVRYWKVWRD